MIIGTFVAALGCWLRYIAEKNYALALFGEELNALAQIWVLETPMGFLNFKFLLKNEKKQNFMVFVKLSLKFGFRKTRSFWQ